MRKYRVYYTKNKPDCWRFWLPNLIICVCLKMKPASMRATDRAWKNIPVSASCTTPQMLKTTPTVDTLGPHNGIVYAHALFCVAIALLFTEDLSNDVNEIKVLQTNTNSVMHVCIQPHGCFQSIRRQLTFILRPSLFLNK